MKLFGIMGWRAFYLLFISVATSSLAVGQVSLEDKHAVTILAWNIEIGGSDVPTIMGQLKELEPFDVVALSEVPQESAHKFAERWGADSFMIGESGGGARLLIAWDPAKFDKIETLEIKEVDGKLFAPGVQAAPLVAHLRLKSNGKELKIMTNHLARGSAELRNTQSQLLVEWARTQTLPVIAVGGYNLDYDIPTRNGNAAFDIFLADGTWKWIEPKELIDTNWADRNRDGQDDYPNSMLDFVFTTGPAKKWLVTAEVIVREGDFPDNEKTSDQRPIRTIIHGLQ